jgi:hypothetical protein
MPWRLTGVESDRGNAVYGASSIDSLLSRAAAREYLRPSDPSQDTLPPQLP